MQLILVHTCKYAATHNHYSSYITCFVRVILLLYAAFFYSHPFVCSSFNSIFTVWLVSTGDLSILQVQMILCFHSWSVLRHQSCPMLAFFPLPLPTNTQVEQLFIRPCFVRIQHAIPVSVEIIPRVLFGAIKIG